jgi:hypothetical protein
MEDFNDIAARASMFRHAPESTCVETLESTFGAGGIDQ